MVEIAALQPFMDARDAVAGDAFARPLGEAGLAICHGLSDALDEGMSALAGPLLEDGFAVVALGSYGRREQCRHSDLDLMLLFAKDPDADKSNAMLYPLWDSNLQIGHSVRSIEQIAPSAGEDVQTCTALLDARLVCGDAEVFERFRGEMRTFLRRNRAWLRDELAGYRAEALEAEPWQLQEPDLKNGRGGLRSLQTAHWLGLADAAVAGTEPPPLAPERAEALEAILATRNALHSLEDRANDKLRRDLLPRVCGLLGVDPLEWGMRLSAGRRALDAAAASALAAEPPAAASGGDGGGKGRRWMPWRRGKDEAAAAEASPAPEAAPPPPAAGDGEGGNDLERLLSILRGVGPGQSLDPLPASAWLERLLPEWEVLRNRPHTAPFHLHSYDVHSWRTVAEVRRAAEIDEDGTGSPEAAAGIENDDLLLITAMLHDIGKGHGGQHSERGAVIAERFAARAGLGEDDTRRLTHAILHHLLLPTVATRRDISDDRVIREVADTAGDQRMLNLLYVISIADARACGPSAWDAWKARLMHTLYARVTDALSEVSLRTIVGRRRRAVLSSLTGFMTAQTVEEHLKQLPTDYLLSVDPMAVGRHLELIVGATITASESGLDGPLPPVLDHDQVGGVDRLTVIAGDQPALLEAIAGALAAHNINVLGGAAYTRDDGIAIDVMHVGDARGWGIGERRWERIFRAMKGAISGDFPIEERLAEVRAEAGDGGESAPALVYGPQGEAATQIEVDNARDDEYSIIEVQAPGRVGVRYSVTRTLRELAMDIHMAKINTFGDEIMDAFYVRRLNESRIEADDEIERVVARVGGAIAALDADEDGDGAAPGGNGSA